MAQPHFHTDENGVLVRCYHKSKAVLGSFNFWLGVTISFPIEHYLWTEVWPFYLLAGHFGLIGGH